jgi:hypothetical protein
MTVEVSSQNGTVPLKVALGQVAGNILLHLHFNPELYKKVRGLPEALVPIQCNSMKDVEFLFSPRISIQPETYQVLLRSVHNGTNGHATESKSLNPKDLLPEGDEEQTIWYGQGIHLESDLPRNFEPNSIVDIMRPARNGVDRLGLATRLRVATEIYKRLKGSLEKKNGAEAGGSIPKEARGALGQEVERLRGHLKNVRKRTLDLIAEDPDTEKTLEQLRDEYRNTRRESLTESAAKRFEKERLQQLDQMSSKQLTIQSAADSGLSSLQAAEIVEHVLPSDGLKLTKAVPGTNVLSLLPHSRFDDDRIEESIAEIRDFDRFLEVERDIMIQIEAMEAVRRALDASGGEVATLKNYLAEESAKMEAYFDAFMTEVKKKDRPLEEAVRAFHAFLTEARFKTDAQLSQIHVINGDPQDLLSNPYFGKNEHFGPIEGLRRVENMYFLLVLGMQVSEAGTAASVGDIALKHGGMAFLDAKVGTLRDLQPFRCDAIGKRSRLEAALRRGLTGLNLLVARDTRVPVPEKKVNAVAEPITGDVPGLEGSVICFAPIRVREASRYEEELGDVVIPSSYVLAGKIAHSLMASESDGFGTSPSGAKKKYEIGTGPSLFDHEGEAANLPKGLVYILTTSTPGERGNWVPVSHFDGLYTARGGHFQIMTGLALQYLRRIMTLLCRVRIGEPQRKAEDIRREIEEVLQTNLMGNDDRYPFTRLSVVLDRNSAEGKRAWEAQGVRYLVKVAGKDAIANFWVQIMPEPENSESGTVIERN